MNNTVTLQSHQFAAGVPVRLRVSKYLEDASNANMLFVKHASTKTLALDRRLVGNSDLHFLKCFRQVKIRRCVPQLYPRRNPD